MTGKISTCPKQVVQQFNIVLLLKAEAGIPTMHDGEQILHGFVMIFRFHELLNKIVI